MLLHRSRVKDLLEGVLNLLLVEPPSEESSRRLWWGQLDGLFVEDADAVFVVVVVRRTHPAKDGHLFGIVALRGAGSCRERGTSLSQIRINENMRENLMGICKGIKQ